MQFIARLCLFGVGCVFAPAALGAAMGSDWGMCVLFATVSAACLHRAAVGFRTRGRITPRRPDAVDAWSDFSEVVGPDEGEQAAVASLADFDFTKDAAKTAARSHRSSPQRKRPPPLEGDLWIPRGSYEVAVIGESQFQPALVRLVGGSTEAWIEHAAIAELVCAPQAREDFPDTGDVFVQINGARVGEMPDGIAFRRRLIRYGRKGRTTQCHAQIRGGGKRTDGTVRMLGVWLDIPPFRW